MRILSGVQSSGRQHLGNYFGAIAEFVKLQDEGEAYFFIANYHSLTSVKQGPLVKQFTLETAAAYFALGLEPEKSVVYRQSDVPEVLELYWILGTVTPISNLERAHSYKDKVDKGIAPDLGLFAYPVLMAADILLYDADVVPVGKDQIQHLEFARDWAQKFNIEFVPGYQPTDPLGLKSKKPGLLKLPQARVREETASVPGIDGQKMSKSHGNTIDLFGELKAVEKAFKSIKTDSTPKEAPKPTENQPLYVLLKTMLEPEAFASVQKDWLQGGQGYGYFKDVAWQRFQSMFAEPRKKFAALVADEAGLERTLQFGAEKARRSAAPVIDRIRRAVGLR